MAKRIVQAEHDVLRKTATEVAPEELGGPELGALVDEMREALRGERDGVALAAPQIGVSKRIFIVSGKVFARGEENEELPEDRVYVNPEIVKHSRERELMDEGCLSVRYKYGKIERFKKVRIRASDEHGTLFECGASDLLAQIFQHETDHLDGKLFTDRAIDVQDIPPESPNHKEQASQPKKPND